MRSIFSPRVVVGKDGVVSLRTYSNPVKFDKFYIDQNIKQFVKKIGEGEDDFIIQTKVVDSKRSIKEVIESNSDGVFNIDQSLKLFAETGDLTMLPPGLNDGEMTDYTKLPEDHAAYMKMLVDLGARYDALDPELKKGLSMADFVKQVDDKTLESYLLSIKPKEEDKKEDKKDE